MPLWNEHYIDASNGTISRVFIHFWSPFVQFLIYPLVGLPKHPVIVNNGVSKSMKKNVVFYMRQEKFRLFFVLFSFCTALPRHFEEIVNEIEANWVQNSRFGKALDDIINYELIFAYLPHSKTVHKDVIRKYHAGSDVDFLLIFR